jgi:hypothetical protein
MKSTQKTKGKPPPMPAAWEEGAKPADKPVAAPEPATRPKPVDFSAEAVRKAVLQKTLQRPTVLYPTAVGGLGALAAILLGPSLIFIAPALLGLGGGFVWWLLDYTLGKNKHSAEVLRQFRERLSGQRTAALTRLQGQLNALNFEVGLAQLQQFQAKFDAFNALLGRKLDPAELTYARYLGMTEQVFLAGIDNLNRCADTLLALGTIDKDKLQARIRVLETDQVDSPGQDLEIKTLRERLLFHEAQMCKTDQWLAQNEGAMSQMDHVMAAIADMETTAGQASMPMEAAMQELKTLVERASLYSVQR